MSEKKSKEIIYHHNFLNWLDKAHIAYDSWGSSGPDVILDDYSILGEFKIKENKTSYKDAFLEIQKRTKPQFDIHNFKNFFILTKEYIRIYDSQSIDWDNLDFKTYLQTFDFLDNCIAVFENSERDKEIFLEFIQRNCNKISVDGHLSDILDLLLSDELDLTIMDAIIILSKLNEFPVFLRKSIVYNPNSSNEYSVNFKSHESLDLVRRKLIDRYYIQDFNKVKEYIKYNYSSHLSDTKKSNLGKYYTPKFVVEYMKSLLKPLINCHVNVIDIACGCGAFLEIFSDCHIMGRDIDKNAIDVLKTLGFSNIEVDNSLVNVNRDKYGFLEDTPLIVVGNPPYNDTSSKNKRFGTKMKSVMDIEIDSDIYAKDIGQSFLKAYAKLNPDYICVLHPLAYLIKKSNFKALTSFFEKYELNKGIIFSSCEFPDLKGNTAFPIVIALYKKGKMAFEEIQNFEFEVMGQNKIFKLSSFETIDTVINGKSYIRKYPIKKDKLHIIKSDIDLYQYNIRDTNSLMSSGNLMCLVTTENLNYVTVNFNELYKYCYLNMYKFYFKNDFLVGNLSPLINIYEYETNKNLQNLMIIGTILKNSHRLKSLNYKDKGSCIYTKYLINDFRDLANKYEEDSNFYKWFVEIVDKDDLTNIDKIYKLIEAYFRNLRKYYGL